MKFTQKKDETKNKKENKDPAFKRIDTIEEKVDNENHNKIKVNKELSEKKKEYDTSNNVWKYYLILLVICFIFFSIFTDGQFGAAIPFSLILTTLSLPVLVIVEGIINNDPKEKNIINKTINENNSFDNTTNDNQNPDKTDAIGNTVVAIVIGLLFIILIIAIYLEFFFKLEF